MSGIFSLEGVAATLSFAKVAYDEWQLRKQRQDQARRYAGLSGAAPSVSSRRSLARRPVHPARSRRPSQIATSMDMLGTMMSAQPVRRKMHPVKSADDRVKYIDQMVKQYRYDPMIRKIAMDVLTRKCNGRWCVPEKNWLAEVKALFIFIRQNVRYTRDPAGMDTYTSPLRTLGWFKAGDCDCYMILGGCLLQSVGYPIKIRIVHTAGEPTWNHIYLLAGIPTRQADGSRQLKWLPFDTSMDKPLGFQPPRAVIIKYKDFLVE